MPLLATVEVVEKTEFTEKENKEQKKPLSKAPKWQF